MRRDIRRTVLGALALATTAGCGAGAPADEQQQTAAKQGLGDGPDFVVTALSGPPSVTPGTSFEVTTTVCNRGNWDGVAQVALVLSPDSHLSATADMWGGSLHLGYLPPGLCVTQRTSMSPPPWEGAVYLGAIADPYDSEFEFDENNNARLSGPMGVGYNPDYVVTKVTGPASVEPGQPLTAQVTVCNQGTWSNGSTDVVLVLSSDDVIQLPQLPGQQTGDFVLGGASVGYVNHGQCVTVPVSGNANLPYPGVQGAYHLGAVVDPGQQTPELIEDNNASSGYRLGVGTRPDFVVTGVKGPASAQSGQGLTAQVTVCNQGTQPASTDVALFLSADDVIQPGSGPGMDSPVGGASTGPLNPSQCVTVPVSGSAYLPYPGVEGAYHLGAMADPGNGRPEIIEDNNASSGYRIGVGDRPDFIVTGVKAPPSVQPGQSLTAQVTVCNQGTQPASTDVALILSSDEALQFQPGAGPMMDTIVGGAPLSSLYPGQCVTVPVTGPANLPYPGIDGAYVLGAMVDPVNNRSELLEENNTHSAYRIGVGLRPDFIVTEVKAPASVQSGQSLTAEVTVCNQGTQADITDVELYVSADSVIRPATGPAMPEDRPVGGASVGPLNPGQCGTVPVSGSAYPPPPGTEGAYFLGAAANPRGSRAELNHENNTHGQHRLGIGSAPDFVVTAVQGPASVPSGQSFMAQVTVCNQGTQPASTDVELYVSADAIIRPVTSGPMPPEDRPVGGAPVSSLYPGQCVTVPVPGSAYLPAPGTEGAYHLGAVVDPGNSRPELIEDNNTSSGYVLGVGYRPDFVVTSVKGPASVQQGQSLTAQVTVCNQGTQPDSTDVVLVLSADAIIRPAFGGPWPSEDTPVGGASVGFLLPGQCSTVPVSGSAYLPFPGTDGPYFLGAVVDPGNNRSELIEENNASSGYRLGVGLRPDFIVTAVKGPASAQSGQGFTAQVTVCNQGTRPDSPQVELYLSADAIIRPYISGPSSSEDRLVGGASMGPLNPGQCVTVPVPGSASLPAPGIEGAYFLGAVVDPHQQSSELLEENNIHAGHRMGVGQMPDFVVTGVKGPGGVQSGQGFTAQVTVCNQGTQPDSTDVTLFLSADATIRPFTGPGPMEDRPVGGAPVGPLYPGQCVTVPVAGTANLPSPGTEGAYHLGAVVDAANNRPELIEDNNTSSGYRLGVGNQADFIVTSVKGPASAQSGQGFNAQVTVCNQGTLPDSTDVTLFLSADATIRPAPGGPGPMEDRPVGGAPVGLLTPGQCVTVPVPATASLPSPGTEGAYHLGAAVDAGNSRPELIEDNNTSSGYVLGVGLRPDFIVSSVSGAYSALPGSTFTATVTVCNQGQQGGTADVDLFLSADTTLRLPGPASPPEDFPLGTVRGLPLNAGKCLTQSLSVTAPSVPEGAYYLVAGADLSNTTVELVEDNNTFSGGRIGVGSQPDFVVTAVTGPSSVRPGSTLSISATLCNRGQLGGTVDVELFLSADAVILVPGPAQQSDDRHLGSLMNVALSAGQCVSRSLSVPAPNVPEGAYYLGAVADAGNVRVELIDDNNTLVGARIGVGSRPDFVITSVTAPTSVMRNGAFSASFTVCNRGQYPGTAEVELYLSQDSTIRAPTPSQPPEDFPVGLVTGMSLLPGQCVTRSAGVTANVPASGSYYVGAVADPRSTVVELIEDNNTLAGTFLTVTP